MSDSNAETETELKTDEVTQGDGSDLQDSRMSRSMEDVLPEIVERIDKNALRIDDLETMVRKHWQHPILQHIKQGSSSIDMQQPKIACQETDSKLDGLIETNRADVNMTTLRSLSVDTSVGSTVSYMSPPVSSTPAELSENSMVAQGASLHSPPVDTRECEPYWASRMKEHENKVTLEDNGAWLSPKSMPGEQAYSHSFSTAMASMVSAKKNKLFM